MPLGRKDRDAWDKLVETLYQRKKKGPLTEVERLIIDADKLIIMLERQVTRRLKSRVEMSAMQWDILENQLDKVRDIL